MRGNIRTKTNTKGGKKGKKEIWNDNGKIKYTYGDEHYEEEKREKDGMKKEKENIRTKMKTKNEKREKEKWKEKDKRKYT